MFGRKRKIDDFSAEIESHLQLEVERLQEQGLSAEAAQAVAYRAFGNVTEAQERFYESGHWLWWDHFWQDVRYGLRTLRKSLGFTTVAVITLALGIGANTAVFSFIDAVLLRPLPVKDPQQLVVFSWSAHAHPKLSGHGAYGDCSTQSATGDCSFSVPFFKTVRAQSDAFTGMAAFAGPLDYDFSGNGLASVAQGQYVSGDLFSTLGVRTIVGRSLGMSDDSPSAPPAIVLSYAYWQRAFGGDRSVVGRTVRVNKIPVAIVGVAEPRFTSLTPGNSADFFMPFSAADRIRWGYWGHADRLSDPSIWWAVVVGRLKDRVPLAQAQAAATTMFVNETTHGATPLLNEADAPAIKLLPAAEGLNGESSQIAPIFYLLMFAVGLILLVACANVAGLMLARSAIRQKEMALRLALGAGRARILRQLLTESVLLSFAGGALGVFLSIWGVKVMTALFSSGYEVFPFVIGLDWRVLLFTVGITFAAGILFGLSPALRCSRVDLTPSFKETFSPLPGSGGRWLRLGDALVIVQIALSIVVLIGAGLLVRTMRNLHNSDPGFDTRNILLFGVNPSAAGYTDQKTAQLYTDLQQRFAALPGVISVSYSTNALLSGNSSGDDFHLDGAPATQNIGIDTLPVGLKFFSTMRIPLLAGRTFNSADFAATALTSAAEKTAEDATRKSSVLSSTPPSAPASMASFAHAPPVPVIINQMFARTYFPKQNPLGKHIGDSQETDWSERSIRDPGYIIIGIAGDTKYARLHRDIAPMMFLPLVSNSAHFELRAAGDPLALIKPAYGIVSRADDNLPLFDVRTQTEQTAQGLFAERLMSRISSLFGALALALACIGLYGLLSYEVARRTRELGIRMALGAQRKDLLRLVVGQGILLVLIGGAIGISAAMGVTRFMSTLLYGIHADDPLTFAGVAILLTLVALAACYIPARRAMRVDPMVALRHE